MTLKSHFSSKLSWSVELNFENIDKRLVHVKKYSPPPYTHMVQATWNLQFTLALFLVVYVNTFTVLQNI